MDLPRLLFGAGFQIFIVTPQMFLGSFVNILRTCEANHCYSLRRIKTLLVPSEDSMAAIWVVFGHSAVIPPTPGWIKIRYITIGWLVQFSYLSVPNIARLRYLPRSRGNDIYVPNIDYVLCVFLTQHIRDISTYRMTRRERNKLRYNRLGSKYSGRDSCSTAENAE